MRRKILLAVDGSETSKRAVEYVGEILCDSGGIDITLYHVLEIPPMLLEHGGSKESLKELEKELKEWERRKKEQVEKEVFAPARRTLREKGICAGADTIQTKLTEDAHPVALAIIREIKQGGYDTVVLGRQGTTMLKEFVFGSVACKVVHHITGCAIWIVE